MYQGLKWLRLVPDKPGKGGWKTGFHTFQSQPVNDTRRVTRYHVYRGRWTKDHDTKALAGITNDTTATFPASVHAYVYPSLTDPTAQPGVTILGHHLVSGPSNHYWDFTNNTSRSTHAGNSVPATFLNIAGRCFVADGAREGMVLDDRTPAIHAQPNQTLGIGAPTQAMPNTGFNPGGTGYIHYGSPYINHPNSANRIGTILAADTSVNAYVIDPWAAIYTGAPMAAGGAAFSDAVTSDTSPFTATGTISITTGTSLVTLAGATWPTFFKYAGLAINFNGYSYVISTHGSSAGLPGGTSYDLDGGNLALSNVQLVILGVYDGPSLTGVTYTITGCHVTMPNNSTCATINTGALGYSQITNSYLVQVKVLCYRAGGLYRNLGNISLGPQGGGGLNIIVNAAMGTAISPASNFLRSPGSTQWTTFDNGSTFVVDGAGASGTMLISTMTGFISPLTVTLADANASGAAITGKRAWWGKDFLGITDAAMAGASTTLTSVSAPFTLADEGKRIMVAGAGGVGAPGVALFTTIVAFVNVGQVTLALPNISGGAITGAQAEWGGGTANTTVGPTYAYAWYDPETGHCSNISPLFQIPRPTTIGPLYADLANLTPIFQIDPGSISYPDPTVDGVRFSHILFFRTLSTPGNSTLYPIGSLMPYVGKVHPGSSSTRGSWNPGVHSGWAGLPNNYTAGPPVVTGPNWWFDFSSDSDLLLSGGFRAPQYTNGKPMALLRGGVQQPGKPAHQAYWDRRLWVVNTQEPDVVAFSCDEAQCPLGIPEESFPPTNRLRIPSIDGRVLGMRVFAEMMLITTERWAYTVVGNNESNYRLIRISTRMGGVGTYQMDEFSSDVEGVPSTIYFFGKDGIFYEWIPGGNITDISGPVQDVLKPQAATLALYQATRVHCMSIAGRRVVCIASPALSSISLGPLLFDIDNRTWTDTRLDDGVLFSSAASSLGVAFSPLYGLDPPVQELAAIKMFTSGDITVRRWMEDNPTHAFGPAVLETFPMNFDGLKTLKQLCMVNLHCSGGAATCQVSINETDFATIPMVTMGAYVDPLGSIYAPSGALPVDTSTAEDLVVLTAQFYQPGGGAPGGNAQVGYRFIVRITGDESTAQDIYAIDIGYLDISEQGEGDV